MPNQTQAQTLTKGNPKVKTARSAARQNLYLKRI